MSMPASHTHLQLNGLARRLVEENLLSADEAASALEEATSHKLPLVRHLVDNNLLDSRAIASAASREFGIPLFDLDAMDLDVCAFKLVSEKLITKHNVLPLFKRGSRLFVGVSDPTNLQALDDIRFHAGATTEPILVEDKKLSQIIARLIEANDTTMEVLQDADLDGLDISTGDEEPETNGGEIEVDDTPIVRFVNKVLLDAINKGASDLHFEPYEKIYRVRFRMDGILKEVAAPPQALANKIAARIKVMSQLDISERRVPQDGRMKMKLSKNRAIDFRVSTCPTLFGEKIVMRILDPSSAKLGIDALGYEPDQKKLYMDALAKPYGMILVTGPTGSGKTVSLYTGLNILNTEDRNISTAEDPAEINLPGINQVNVNPKAGLTFASALKAFLRQDPDVIMVGEIRDKETGDIAIKAAQTGHMVLSTLHTNDAPKTLTRMVNMGIAPFNIASAVSLIIAQRLGRRLCSHCKQPHELPRQALIDEGFGEDELDTFTVYKPVGCDQCNDGYKGRVGIYQVMPISSEMGRIIMDGGNSIDLAQQARKEGICDLHQSGLKKVKAGILSLEELHRVITE
ncbi:MAG: type IV-A pilus assembly ATPase PilB [Gammaproteobacteria bacterium]|nr:type IV-A pilus assembly ATPase PilB [Gammaproteobacteria bacterium]